MKQEVSTLENEEFKVSVVEIAGLTNFDIKFGFMVTLSQNKYEVSIEPSPERKKIIVKVFEDKNYPKTFEFTLVQFINMLINNKAKKALMSEEEKINEKAEKLQAEREPKIKTTSSRKPITSSRSKIKTKKTKKSIK